MQTSLTVDLTAGDVDLPEQWYPLVKKMRRRLSLSRTRGDGRRRDGSPASSVGSRDGNRSEFGDDDATSVRSGRPDDAVSGAFRGGA